MSNSIASTVRENLRACFGNGFSRLVRYSVGARASAVIVHRFLALNTISGRISTIRYPHPCHHDYGAIDILIFEHV